MKKLLVVGVAMCACAHAFADWTFNGSNRITSGDWSINVSIADSAKRELKIPDWSVGLVAGEGDLDLSGAILDANGKAWSLVSIGGGTFSAENPLTSVIMPTALRSIGSWVFQGSARLTNVVMNCPALTSLGEACLRISGIKRWTMNAPLLQTFGKDVSYHSMVAQTSTETFNLDSIRDISVCMPFFTEGDGIVRLPSLEKYSKGSIHKGSYSMCGLVIGGAREDGSKVDSICQPNLIMDSTNLEFVVIGHGDNLKIGEWGPFNMRGCTHLRRIFFAGQRPTWTGGGGYFASIPGGSYNVCFYIRPDEPSWDSFIAKLDPLTDAQKTRFRELYGEDEPLPIGICNNKNEFQTYDWQYVSYGDYRAFVNDIIIRSDKADATLADFTPMRKQVDGPADGENLTLNVTTARTLSADKRVRYGYYGYTIETYDVEKGAWSAPVTNFGCTATLPYAATARRLTWLYGAQAYRVSFSDRGFLEEYPESFTVTYPDGEPDADGFLDVGKRVTLAVTGLATEGDHKGRFVGWEGRGAEALTDAAAEVTFYPMCPMNIHPVTEHDWTYTPSKSSESKQHEISDGNWRLLVATKGSPMTSVQLAAWTVAYIAGEGYLRLPNTVTGSDGTTYAMDSYVGSQSFYKCSHIRGLYLPAAVKTIGSQAFSQCSNMCAIEFEPNALNSLEGQCFEWAGNVGEIVFIQTNLTSMGNAVFTGNASVSNLTIRIPNVKNAGGSFSSFVLSSEVDVGDWDISSVTNLPSYGGFNLKGTPVGILRAPSLVRIELSTIPLTVTGIDFSNAVPVSVHANWLGWSQDKTKLNTLIFAGAAPTKEVLDNLLIGNTAVDGAKTMTIYCTTSEPGWADYVDTNLTEKEQAAAAEFVKTLQRRETLLGVYVTSDGKRKAWLVNRPPKPGLMFYTW